MPAFDPRLTLGIAHAITSAYADRNQRDATAKTCRSKRAYSFLICTRTLSNSALAARAARSASSGYVGARDQNGCDLPLPRSTLELRAPEVIGGKARAGECFNLPADGRSAASDSQFRKISILFQATTSRPAWAGAGFR